MSEAAISGERELSGPEKAAALLLMMGKPPAARLLKQFDQPDLRAVALAAAGLGAIPATMLDRLVEEFVTDFSAGADLLGDAGQAKSLLADALPPEQIADILGLASGETGPPDVWRSLGQAPESAIVALLMAERAATATYILSRLDPAAGDEACRRAAARSAQRRALRIGRAARLDAACRPADRRGGGSGVETGVGLGRRRRGTVPPRRHHQQPRSGGGGGRHASARASPPEGRGHRQNDAVFLQRSAETVRAGEGALVRPRIDRHRRHGRCGGPTRISATPFSRRCPRAGVVWWRANSIPAPSRPARRCEGAQSHRRHRARHGEPQRNRAWRPSLRRLPVTAMTVAAPRVRDAVSHERRRRSRRSDRGADRKTAA